VYDMKHTLSFAAFALSTLLGTAAVHAKPSSAPSAAASSSADKAERARPKRRRLEEAAPRAASPKALVKGKSRAKQSEKKRESKPCFAREVHVVRKRGDEIEHRHLALTHCDGTPNPAAVDSVSVLSRARDVGRPYMPEIRAYRRRPPKQRNADYLSEHVMRVHPDLLVRLQKVADHFAGKTLEIISGHRPDARVTSRHHHARALDIRVEGVSREALRDFLRRLPDTGVGYYPHSYFVHMDVREGKGYWVDRSGPGEEADYGTWPPTKREIESAIAPATATFI
jgi:hypothetical protein